MKQKVIKYAIDVVIKTDSAEVKKCDNKKLSNLLEKMKNDMCNN